MIQININLGTVTAPEPLLNLGSAIVNNISVIGIVISVIVLIVMGIKYMLGSASEKAEYKRSMIPYLVGVVLLVSTTKIVEMIVKMVGETTGTTI